MKASCRKKTECGHLPRVFGFRISNFTLDETVGLILSDIRKGRKILYGDLNVASVIHARRDPDLKAFFDRCDIVNIDGYGVVLGGRLCGIPGLNRVAGIDLFQVLLAQAESRGLRPFLLGAKPNVLEKTLQRIRLTFPRLELAGVHHGYFWDREAEIVRNISAARPDMLFIGISSPKKELFVRRNADLLRTNLIMGVGGSFDVLAGVRSRAPRWMQKLGMEWCFRLAQEPRRLWRRYLATNAAYGLMILRHFLDRRCRSRQCGPGKYSNPRS